MRGGGIAWPPRLGPLRIQEVTGQAVLELRVRVPDLVGLPRGRVNTRTWR